MPDDQHVRFTSRPEATVLDGPDDQQREALGAAGHDLAALRACAARWPTLLEAWAGLAEAAADPVDAYAYARVGYHRGLDALRRAGWRGSGEVPAAQPANLGFLRSLNALRRAAASIGETDEAARCELFLHQLDPGWQAQLEA
jgi:hypothetical protein